MKKKDFNELLHSVKQASQIMHGERKPSRVFIYEPGDIASIRLKLGATQKEFAEMIRVSIGTLRNWEQGHRSPTGPAKALLTLVAAMPKQARKVLAK